METYQQYSARSDRTDRLLELTAWSLLLGLVALAVYAYNELPEIIPVHFDIHGRPDNYGDRSTIFALPVIGVLLLLIIHILLHYTPTAKSGKHLTSERAYQKYRIATRMIRIVKIAILIDFIVITAVIWLVAMGRMTIPGVWFILLILGIMILPVGIALWRSSNL